jgi:hypothetical protein
MNEIDDDLAQLFARDESLVDDEAFAAAVRRRVARERRNAKTLRVALAAAIAAAAVAVVAFAPAAVLHPLQLVPRLLSSPLGAIAGVLGAVGLAWWSRFEDA